MAGSLSYEIINTCVQCGLCLPTCPTYRETYREQSSPRGRLRLMLAVADARLDVLDPGFTSQMSECLNCRACEAVCPSGVHYGPVLEEARAKIEAARDASKRRPPLARVTRWLVFGALFRDLRLIRAASAAARLYQQRGAQRLARRSGLLRLLRLDTLERQLPPMSARFFAPRGQVYAAIGERRGRVGLLAGCIMHTAFADVHRATIRVLRRNGWEVVVPAGQGCCGALHTHAGDPERGRELAHVNIDAFAQAGVDYVVTNAAGCGAALKEYARLLADDGGWAERGARFTLKARDVSELLATAPLRGPLGPVPLTVTYQEPCHLAHAQRQTAAPRALLAQIPDLKLVEMAESSLCCGSAGIYSVTEPAMSARLRDRKTDHALATGAQIVVSANPGCMLQVNAGLHAAGAAHVQTRHLIEMIDMAYGAATS